MKIKIGNEEIEAVQVAFSAVTEPWTEYHLEDGRTIRIKTVATKIYRTEKMNDDGIPLYSIASQQIIVANEKQE